MTIYIDSTSQKRGFYALILWVLSCEVLDYWRNLSFRCFDFDCNFNIELCRIKQFSQRKIFKMWIRTRNLPLTGKTLCHCAIRLRSWEVFPISIATWNNCHYGPFWKIFVSLRQLISTMAELSFFLWLIILMIINFSGCDSLCCFYQNQFNFSACTSKTHNLSISVHISVCTLSCMMQNGWSRMFVVANLAALPPLVPQCPSGKDWKNKKLWIYLSIPISVLLQISHFIHTRLSDK
jgi:hypothetical protein